MLSPEQLQKMEEEEDETGGLNGETAVWGPGMKETDETGNGGFYPDKLDWSNMEDT